MVKYIYYVHILINIHLATSENVIDIDDLNYEWQLQEAQDKLELFVKSFDMKSIGLTNEVWNEVCPEANKELFDCFSSQTNQNVEQFYEECLHYIDDIFQKGSQDLIEILGNFSIF